MLYCVLYCCVLLLLSVDHVEPIFHLIPGSTAPKNSHEDTCTLTHEAVEEAMSWSDNYSAAV